MSISPSVPEPPESNPYEAASTPRWIFVVFVAAFALIGYLFYAGNDFFQYLSRFHHPFATGMFMLFDLQQFRKLRGFHEQVAFAEDYLLSQQVERKRFGIVRGGVYTTNRRFQKMGHLRVGWLFLKTAMNYWNQNYFLRDHKYWQT